MLIRKYMTFPRLRIRELLILVVYAALIGQALVLCYVKPGLPNGYLPSNVPGHVWVPMSEALEFLGFERRGAPDGGRIVFSSDPKIRRVVRDSKLNRPDAVGNAQGELFMLLPEDLLK